MDVRITTGGRPETMPQPRGDCSVRALAIFLKMSYKEIEDVLLAHTDYTPRRGVSNTLLYKLLEELGMTYIDSRVRLSAKNARERLPEKCLLVFRHHICAYEAGMIYDSFNIMQNTGTKQTRGVFVADFR